MGAVIDGVLMGLLWSFFVTGFIALCMRQFCATVSADEMFEYKDDNCESLQVCGHSTEQETERR